MISIGFFRPKTPWARLQTWWTKGEFSHVCVILPIGGHTLYAHALPTRGLVLTAIELSHAPDVVLPQPWLDEDATVEWILDRLGITYGWRDAADFVLKDTRKDHVGFTCSEAVIRLLGDGLLNGHPDNAVAMGILSLSREPWKVLPDDLARILRV